MRHTDSSHGLARYDEKGDEPDKFSVTGLRLAAKYANEDLLINTARREAFRQPLSVRYL